MISHKLKVGKSIDIMSHIKENIIKKYDKKKN